MSWMLWVLAGVGGVLAAAGAIQLALDTLTGHLYPPPGDLVDLGGWRLHLHHRGEGVPVVLHAGFGGSSFDWGVAMEAPPEGTELWAWDRPGMAWSDRAPGPVADPIALIEALHSALEVAGVGAPAIHVGHSLGGAHALAFARRYPDQVAGLVLVDSAHPELLKRLPPEDAAKQFAQAGLLRWARYLAPFGLGRLLRLPVCNMGKTPGRVGQAARALGYQTKGYFALYDEVRMLLAADPRALLAPLGDMPLVVLSTLHEGPNSELLAELQTELAALARGSRLTVIEGSGHFIQLDRPEVVAEAVVEVIERSSLMSVGSGIL